MKNKITLLLLLGFTAIAPAAIAQSSTAGNFSDWNIPPPQMPGTGTKGNASNVIAKVLTLTDVAKTSLPLNEQVHLANLAQLTQIAPTVNAPDMPAITDEPAGLPTMPLPAVPDAVALPKRVIADNTTELVADIPFPAAPELPAFPTEPASSPGDFKNSSVHIPLTPAIIAQPTPTSLLAESFPFTQWNMPLIPLHINFILVAPKIVPVAPVTVKTITTIKKVSKTVKKHRRRRRVIAKKVK